MTAQPIDQKVRRAALDPERSFIVQAPAGSGKTGLLTQRFLVLLAGVEHPEEIVAITFTRKAAAEMRDRIIGALRMAASDDLPDDSYERETRELALAALARDREKGWQLLAQPGRLRVRTIDSFCQYLAGQAPLLSGLGGGMAVAENAGALYDEAARSVIQELEAPGGLGDALALLLTHRDNDTERLKQLLAEMLARRDQWLHHLRAGEERQALEHALRLAVEKGLSLAHQALAPWARELLPLLRFAAENSADDSVLADCRYLTDLPATDGDALPQWQGVVELLLTRKEEWRKSVNRNQGFPAGCEEKAAMQDLLEALRDEDELLRTLASIRVLPLPAYEEYEWQVLDALLQVLRQSAAHLQLVFAAHGQVDFAEIMLRARAALSDENGPTDLALKLDYRIHHLLVDEFQDTSRNQYELFLDLTAGWQPGDGRSLFLVGDPMQSIYRFREAEVGLFLQAWEQGMGGLPLEPLNLEVNFRSSQGIVDWVNEHFPQVLPSRDDAFTGAVSYVPSRAFKEPARLPAVEIHPQGQRDDLAEAQQVLDIVQQRLFDDSQGDIAILVRNRSHGAAITDALNQAGIAFQAVDMESLATRPVVQDLMALSLALLYPADRISWLALLRSPLCGLTLEDLHSLAAGERRAVPELLADEACSHRMSGEGRQRLAGLRPLVGDALGDLGSKPLADILQGLWLALGGPVTVGHTAALEDARMFFELLRSQEAAGLLTREDLQDALSRLYARPDSSTESRVRIMTMHKAKGLEFDTVILPGLGRIPRRDDSRLLYWLETVDDEGGAQLILGPMKSAAAHQDSLVSQYIRQLEKCKGAYEDGRLLYVAATRAKNKLHLLGHARFDARGNIRPDSGSLLASLWPSLGQHWEALQRPEEVPPSVESIPDQRPRLRRIRAEWQLPPLPESVPGIPVPEVQALGEGVEFDWAGDLARVVGIVAHRLLQHIAQAESLVEDFAPLEAAAIMLLRREGIAETALDQGLARVRQAVENTLASERGRWILDAGHQEAACEYPLTAMLEGRPRHMIVDRTFVDTDGLRWIIDYKTGHHEGTDVEAFLDREQERYCAQLEAYARAFRLMDGRPLRLALYYPMLDGWREWMPGDE
ncbi:UvrD-helicase domain-containing protein [Thiolapillus brandeum]|uniref:DNA 3'-5' helicase n=1 Tax=Thiolapillus brandeum TaxID=1076588 RepID=A0A7U6GJT4_9GAMM|nr:UvrD-helicase domain-containing protein [Thiolapillus brandeum]BAO44942.1 ATP-dependent nuclease subunit A [Thiolapillus brandeum]